MPYKAGKVDYSDDFREYTDELNRLMEYLDGFDKDLPKVTISKTAPSNPKEGDLWFHVRAVETPPISESSIIDGGTFKEPPTNYLDGGGFSKNLTDVLDGGSF